MNPTTCEPNNAIWKLLIVASFLMLSMLTWGMSPLQKLVEKVQYKETVKAKLKVCNEMRSMADVYTKWTGQLFTNGCLWEARNVLLMLHEDNKKEQEDIRKQWQTQEGSKFETINNHCMEAAADNQRENNIRDKVLTPLYHDKLDCPAVYEEAEKLDIKDEDVQ